MDLLGSFSTFGIMLLGMVLAFLVRSRNHITEGTFSFSVWRSDNASRVIWVVLVCAVVTALLTLDPESLNILEEIGLTVDATAVSPAFFGALITSAVHTVTKTEVLKRNKAE